MNDYYEWAFAQHDEGGHSSGLQAGGIMEDLHESLKLELLVIFFNALAIHANR